MARAAAVLSAEGARLEAKYRKVITDAERALDEAIFRADEAYSETVVAAENAREARTARAAVTHGEDLAKADAAAHAAEKAAGEALDAAIAEADATLEEELRAIAGDAARGLSAAESRLRSAFRAAEERYAAAEADALAAWQTTTDIAWQAYLDAFALIEAGLNDAVAAARAAYDGNLTAATAAWTATESAAAPALSGVVKRARADWDAAEDAARLDAGVPDANRSDLSTADAWGYETDGLVAAALALPDAGTPDAAAMTADPSRSGGGLREPPQPPDGVVDGFFHGLGHGAKILANGLSFGYAYDGDVEQILAENGGLAYRISAGSAQVAREALITAGSMGVANAVTAARAAGQTGRRVGGVGDAFPGRGGRWWTPGELPASAPARPR